MIERFIEIIPQIEALGIPVAYDKFQEEQKLPYAAYMDNGTDNFIADNSVYFVGNSITFELYLEKFDYELIKSVENIFTLSLFLWSRSSLQYIETEKMFVTIFTVT